MTEENGKSEFGEGFLYPLALFLAHAGELRKDIESYVEMEKKNPGMFGADRGASIWLYGAADHLFVFDPDAAPSGILRDRCKEFRDECLSKRLPIGDENTVTKERAGELLNEVKALFLAFDLENGVSAVEAEWN